MGLLENILDYSDRSLTNINVEDREYRTVVEGRHHVIVGLAFGTTSCNERLAQTVHDARAFFGINLPAILQREIFESYVQKYGDKKTVSIGATNGNITSAISEIDTKGVLELAKENIDSRKLSTFGVIYVAHPAHVHRVIEVGNKLEIYGTPFIEKAVKWSDTNDKQRWTISPSRWAVREVLTRIHHKFKGYT
jgi:hypothetical protein